MDVPKCEEGCCGDKDDDVLKLFLDTMAQTGARPGMGDVVRAEEEKVPETGEQVLTFSRPRFASAGKPSLLAIRVYHLVTDLNEAVGSLAFQPMTVFIRLGTGACCIARGILLSRAIVLHFRSGTCRTVSGLTRSWTCATVGGNPV